MKILRTYLLLLGVFCLGGNLPAYAVDSPDEMLPNPAMEQQAQKIGQTLRCLVCQNESIEESSAPLARDLRSIIRQQLKDGRTPEEIQSWMTLRYGEFIHLTPRFSYATMLLWFMPVLSLIIAALLARHLQRRTPTPPKPLSPTERALLDTTLKKD